MKKAGTQKEGFGAFRLFAELLVAVFVIDSLVMVLFHIFIEPLHLSVVTKGFLDNFATVIFLLLITYLLLYRPLSLERAKYKQALETTQQLKTGYSVIIRTAMDGFWLVDTKGRILDVNDAYCNLTGYSRQELLAMSVFDLRAQENPEDTKRHIQRIIESGSGRFESKHRCKDGRVVDLDVSVRYLDVDDGRFFAFLHDITERKRREKELIESSALNHTILQTIPFGMDVVDEEGNILYLSPRFEAAVGKGAIGKKCWQLYRDDKRQCRDCPLREEIIIGETTSIETDGILGGRLFQISHSGMIYQGKKAILEVFQDITERKKIEERLHKLSAAVNQTADIVVITDRNGLIEYVNPAFEAETGYSKEEAIGKTPRIVKSGKQDKAFYERLWRTILSGEVFRDVLINRKKGGDLYYSQKTITPIKDAQGNITHFVSTDKDITDYKLYEQELLRANQELQRLDLMKSEFIANVSHELRTPLAMIKEGVSQSVEGLRGELSVEQKRPLEVSLNNVNRLTRIINSILEISSYDAHRAVLKKKTVDIVSAARQSIVQFSSQAKDKGLAIKENFSHPAIGCSLDKEKIIQVFSHLIDNAVKFTEKGGIEVTILDKAGAVECSVSDTGIGIPKEDIPRVFERFLQFHRGYGPGEKGVGLGLAIIKEIIDLHGGKIWVESQVGKGTKFSFSLPKG